MWRHGLEISENLNPKTLEMHALPSGHKIKPVTAINEWC